MLSFPPVLLHDTVGIPLFSFNRVSRAGTDRGFPDYSNAPRFTVHCHMGIFQVDVVTNGHRRSSPLTTVEFVPPSDYMYMEVPSFYGKHPTTLSRCAYGWKISYTL